MFQSRIVVPCALTENATRSEVQAILENQGLANAVVADYQVFVGAEVRATIDGRVPKSEPTTIVAIQYAIPTSG